MVQERIYQTGAPAGTHEWTPIPPELKPRRANPLMMPVVVPVYLEADEERECLKEAVEQIKDEWWSDIEAAFPKDDFGVTHPLDAPERFALYMQRTLPQDLPLLLLDDYPALFQAGLLPVPASPYWAQSWQEIPRHAERKLRDFQKLWKQYEE